MLSPFNDEHARFAKVYKFIRFDVLAVNLVAQVGDTFAQNVVC